MRKKEPVRRLSKDDLKIVLDTSIPPDVASFMVDMPANTISQYRFRNKYSEGLRKASARFREKMKQQNIEKFGKSNACYNYWSAEDIKYIMTSKDPDSVMAEKLNRTVYSIQKKRERELKRRNNGT